MATLFWQFLTAHVLGDFVFQTERMVAGKRDGAARAYLAHGAVHLALLAGTSWPFLSWRLMVGWGLLIALHLGLDGLKETAGRRVGTAAAHVGLFLTDQLLHVAVILGTTLWLAPHLPEPTHVGSLPGVTADLWAPWLLSTRFWQVAAVYGYVLMAAAVLIRLVLRATGLEQATEQVGGARAGTWIGILERGLVLSLLLVQAEAAVGFILAAKSIARFKELEQRNFAEYYLVGTLLSVGIALAGYLVLR